jgi:hypothetical protein
MSGRPVADQAIWETSQGYVRVAAPDVYPQNYVMSCLMPLKLNVAGVQVRSVTKAFMI